MFFVFLLVVLGYKKLWGIDDVFAGSPAVHEGEKRWAECVKQKNTAVISVTAHSILCPWRALDDLSGLHTGHKNIA